LPISERLACFGPALSSRRGQPQNDPQPWPWLAEDHVRIQIDRVLEEFTSAARSMRLLAEMLERQPQALLLGKGG
jgi:hypothetical protein